MLPALYEKVEVFGIEKIILAPASDFPEIFSRDDDGCASVPVFRFRGMEIPQQEIPERRHRHTVIFDAPVPVYKSVRAISTISEEEWQGIIDPASVEPAIHLDYYSLVSRSELIQSG